LFFAFYRLTVFTLHYFVARDVDAILDQLFVELLQPPGEGLKPFGMFPGLIGTGGERFDLPYEEVMAFCVLFDLAINRANGGVNA
jgi:hypothetical protein